MLTAQCCSTNAFTCSGVGSTGLTKTVFSQHARSTSSPPRNGNPFPRCNTLVQQQQPSCTESIFTFSEATLGTTIVHGRYNPTPQAIRAGGDFLSSSTRASKERWPLKNQTLSARSSSLGEGRIRVNLIG